MNKEPLISIIIPTYNREKCLLDTLHSLLAQPYQNFEIVVIDQSETISEEKKLLIKKETKRIRYFQINERGRSLAKNYGILQAKGELILFCDDDILVEANFLNTHIAIYERDPKIAAASCRLVEEGDPSEPIEGPLRTTGYGKLVNKPWSTRSGYVSSLNGGNMSFKKEVLTKVGFFEEYFEGTSMVEEPDMAYRVIKSGYKVYFSADTTVQHFPQYNGNVAYMKEKRAEWFYFYFYNLLIFYTKYKRTINLPIVFVYALLVCSKHIIIYGMAISGYTKMFKGFFGGIKKGGLIYKIEKASPYFTNCRSPKLKITHLNG
ncbi:MAG: glycosyltransferase family 2 protein [Bacteroidota bacterium]|nr:glycosyltransferase family 2 protein [Bacteroidota bacterium]